MFDSWLSTQLKTRIGATLSLVLLAALLVVLAASCAAEVTPTPPAHLMG